VFEVLVFVVVFVVIVVVVVLSSSIVDSVNTRTAWISQRWL